MSYEHLSKRLEKLTESKSSKSIIKPIIITAVYEDDSIGPEYLSVDAAVEAVRFSRGDAEGTRYPLIVFSDQNTKVRPSGDDAGREQPETLELGIIEEIFSDNEEDIPLGVIEEVKDTDAEVVRKIIGYNLLCQ